MKIETLQFESNHLAIMQDRIADVIMTREQAVISDSIDIEAAKNSRATKFKNVSGNVVVVPLHGYISHRATFWSAMGIESASETFAGWIEDLAENSDVGAIVMDINSPGGTAAGLVGAAERIRAVRGSKPIIAVVNDLMASAAYFLGSAADEIVAGPDSLTGSIGTIMLHLDHSQYLESIGIKATIIKAGKYKSEGNPYEPMSDEAREYEQSVVDDYYETFVSNVAASRGISAGKIKESFGQGRVLTASKAKEVGMVDRIGTLEQVIKDLRPQGKSKSRLRAEMQLADLSVR